MQEARRGSVPLSCEPSEGRDYVGQGCIFGYCGIGSGLRGGLMDVVPGAEDGDGRLRATLPELDDKLSPFPIGEHQIEHHQVESLAASIRALPSSSVRARTTSAPSPARERVPGPARRPSDLLLTSPVPSRHLRAISCLKNRPSTTLTKKGQNVHSTKELDPKRISC
jgi:hypothetical protein